MMCNIPLLAILRNKGQFVGRKMCNKISGIHREAEALIWRGITQGQPLRKVQIVCIRLIKVRHDEKKKTSFVLFSKTKDYIYNFRSGHYLPKHKAN